MAGKFVAQVELDLAALSIQIMKTPRPIQFSEWTFYQPDFHQSWFLLGVFGRKVVMNTMVTYFNLSKCNLPIATNNFYPPAPWQKLRILLYGVNQSKHA